MVFTGGRSVFEERFDGKRFCGNVVAEHIVNRKRVGAGFEGGNIHGVEFFKKAENFFILGFL